MTAPGGRTYDRRVVAMKVVVKIKRRKSLKKKLKALSGAERDKLLAMCEEQGEVELAAKVAQFIATHRLQLPHPSASRPA
jgi:hypothetical protein